MNTNTPDMLAEDDIRFLRYRMEVIREWPPSTRRDATTEAISRRLAAIARSSNCPPEKDLLGLSCRLLDDIFAS